jgi:hypothetical protein
MSKSVFQMAITITLYKHIKTYLKHLKVWLWDHGVVHWVYGKATHQVSRILLIMKRKWEICFKLVGISRFSKCFYIKSLIDYDYNMKSWNY